ncbi:pilus assembly PilX family protein [Marinobacter xestospongiae]|uniref:PilX N-terminal domain-containing pilus assembly protein n=1 Tax=Marinobacter xestospongiae TaxID=994319 RepID=A0ABU3W400_9GAMM|nr:PilX N-terminal domain-containing pilus assembly protein [Marinobacter xestospongiae]MDV2080897.1 PilX N-terminal domain-containing pilus assembly protein [Marinobacter xestospongiae]
MIRIQKNQTVKMNLIGRQQGAALAVSLLLLIIVTLVGLAGMRGTLLQERMAGGAYDRETGFQAAEAALILGARNFSNNRRAWDAVIDANATDLDCSSRTCAANPSGQVAAARWTSVSSGTTDGDFTAIDTTNPPQFVVQRMGLCSSTGAGTGFTGTTDQNEGGPGGAQLNSPGTCYRITARAIDPAAAINAERAQVFLQATYRM